MKERLFESVEGRRRRRAVIYLSAILLLVVGYTVLYSWGMYAYEGKERGFVDSLQVVVQTLTSTGYGADAPWSSVQMNLLMIAMQFSGVLLFFMTLPLFIVPWVEETFSRSVPDTAEGLENHIIICGYTAPVDTLVEELESRGESFVLVEQEEDLAMELYDEGVPVIHGDPESIDTLRSAGIDAAKVLVANSTDERNASIVLSVREARSDIRVVSLVNDPSMVSYIKYAGADDVMSPRFLLGRSLADKVATAVTTDLGDTVEVGEDFEVIELPVQKGSDLAGKALYESHIGRMAGVSVIGAWRRGKFLSAPSPGMRIDENTVLIVAGDSTQLRNLRDMAMAEGRAIRTGRVVIAGYGDVGFAVSRILDAKDIRTTVVDLEPKEEVDIVGDATEQQVLENADLQDADAVIVTLPDDTDAIFSTLVSRELNEDVEVIARSNQKQNVGKMYRAGADYVLGLPTVTGRMLALKILEEDVMSPGTNIKIVRMEAPGLEGRTLGDADVRAVTGCSVIAVERDGTVLSEVDPDQVIEEGDTVVVAGVDEAINDFSSRFGG